MVRTMPGKIKVMFLLAVTLVFKISCGNREDKPRIQPRRVAVAEVMVASPETRRYFPGRVNAGRESNLAFRVAGPIKEIWVSEGEFVRRGQVIAEIDPRDYQLQLQVAQAQYNQVTAETRRVIELFNSQSVTEVDHEKAIAGKELVTAQLARARDQLADTRLKAPFDGFINEIRFSPGEIINTGMPLATLVATNMLEVQVDIPTRLFINRDNFISFQATSLTGNGATVDLELHSYQVAANHNQLHALYLKTSRVTAGDEFAPGTIVNVSVTSRENDAPGYLIPLKALFEREGKTMVWVVCPRESTISSREVEVGLPQGNGLTTILSGLRIGEKVVVAGVNTLMEGEVVEIIAPQSETNVGGLL